MPTPTKFRSETRETILANIRSGLSRSAPGQPASTRHS